MKRNHTWLGDRRATGERSFPGSSILAVFVLAFASKVITIRKQTASPPGVGRRLAPP
jgi:hypothetical protein